MENETIRALASVLRKEYVDEGMALFTYINTTVGNYDDNTGIFVDDQGKEYSEMGTEESVFGPNPYVVGEVIDIDTAYKDFGLEGTNKIDELFIKFHNEAKKYFYLVNIDENNTYSILKFNYKEQLDSILNKNSIKKENEEVIEEQKVLKPKKVSKNKYIYKDGLINADKLFKEVKKTLIAQDEPARRLIVEIARMDLDNSKNNGILLTGKTGVGKTELMKLISENLGRPFLTIDSTQLTSPGYEGKNIEQCLWELYKECNDNKEEAEKAIVFFDEIDKKGSNRKDDVGGRAVLNVLLKFLDGTIYKAAPNMQAEGQMMAVDIDTTNMIVIAGGAFTDVYDHEIEKVIGFTNQKPKEYKPTVKDFVEKGMMTDEFMGRMPIIIRMNDLSVNSMKDILKKSRKSPIKVQKEKFKKVGVKLKFTDKALESIARKAKEQKTGARGLSGIVSNVTYKPFDDCITYRDKYDTVTITDKTIEDNSDYKIKQKEKKTNN